MVYRENEKPKWRSVAITHQIAERILKSVGHGAKWRKVDGYIVLPLSEMRLAVTAFLDRLDDAGIPPQSVQVVVHPESDYAGNGDWRSEFTIFYFGLAEVTPS
ncbi:MAG: hypothetical protein U9Q03_00935 [Patescibacteria group bacterium]|nr:hypothetical protein [Patescibacteria group bacterium]